MPTPRASVRVRRWSEVIDWTGWMSDELDNQNREMPDDSTVEVESDINEQDRADEPPVDPIEALKTGWRDAWQVPTMLVAGGVMLLGIAYGISTKPSPDMSPKITAANRMIENEQYQDAIELLNTEVYPWVIQPDTPMEAKASYHLAKARSIYYGQRKLGIRDDRNDDAVIREYEEFKRSGGEVEPRDQAALANTHIERQQYTVAMQYARDIPESKRYLRDSVYQRAIRSLLDRAKPETEPAMELIAEFLMDPNLPIEHRIWAMETQGRVQLDQGDSDFVITRMLRELPRLSHAQDYDRSRLRLILAQAYVDQGAIEQADDQVTIAQDLSAAGDPHYPQILLMKAMVEDERGNTLEARDLYDDIVQNHTNSDSMPLALLGLGETEAVLGDPVLSLEAYAWLVTDYDRFEIETFPSRAQVLESLLARADESLSSGEPFDAIEYAELGEELSIDQTTPSEIYLMLARSHEGAASELIGQPLEEVGTLLGLEPSARSEVQRHLIQAASYYSLHAERFVVTNLPLYADSLWRSAVLFDRAGDQPEAISAFQTYAETMPSDPRYAEALFRQAEALRAMGDYPAAADVYKGLIEAKEGGAGADIGALADASHVPLAQAFLYDEDPANDVQAEDLLTSAIDGSMGSTETSLFRDALLELAGLYDRTDRPERAIERYEEFRNRYPADPETASVVFRLADAHRRLADSIEDSLLSALPAAERNRRTVEINQHRRDAIARYEDAIHSLDARDDDTLGYFERIALRNAHFYLGDCAFDLGEYDHAINYYDMARDRYGEEPASLVAMVQIVNSYIKIGQIGRAKTANERAKRFYAMMPDEVWDDPTLPMDRDDWERWLAASTALFAHASGS